MLRVSLVSPMRLRSASRLSRTLAVLRPARFFGSSNPSPVQDPRPVEEEHAEKSIQRDPLSRIGSDGFGSNKLFTIRPSPSSVSGANRNGAVSTAASQRHANTRQNADPRRSGMHQNIPGLSQPASRQPRDLGGPPRRQPPQFGRQPRDLGGPPQRQPPKLGVPPTLANKRQNADPRRSDMHQRSPALTQPASRQPRDLGGPPRRQTPQLGRQPRDLGGPPQRQQPPLGVPPTLDAQEKRTPFSNNPNTRQNRRRKEDDSHRRATQIISNFFSKENKPIQASPEWSVSQRRNPPMSSSSSSSSPSSVTQHRGWQPHHRKGQPLASAAPKAKKQLTDAWSMQSRIAQLLAGGSRPSPSPQTSATTSGSRHRSLKPLSSSSPKKKQKDDEVVALLERIKKTRVNDLTSRLHQSPLPRPPGSTHPTDVSTLRSALTGKNKRPTDFNKTAVAGASSAKMDLSAPLTEFIRDMQLRHEDKLKKSGKDALNLANIANAQLPKWRLPTKTNLRDLRRRENEQEKKNEASLEAWRRDKEETKKPVFVDPKDQVVVLPSFEVSLPEASLLLREKSSSLRKILQTLGELPRGDSDNDEDVKIDVDTMELVALELGIKFERPTRRSAPTDEEVMLKRRAAAEESPVDGKTSYESFAPRPPVVCIMGHVDHGKTTLMDALRRRSQAASGGGKKEKKKSKKASKKAKKGKATSGANGDVAGTEAGGITQVISAFQVPLADQDTAAVTFLDTPGHAAFRAMRRSGSDAADIIVLVIAADDGVSEQTVEILDFYKSIVKGSGGGGISMVVAMNKIDKPGIDVDESRLRIESQLLEHGILTEGMPSSEEGKYGPPVQLIPVSGLSGEGLDDLIEGLVLQSEVMDLRADDTTRAEAIVMDARVEKGLGIVADCIVRWGSIEKGDIIVSGSHKGKVRILKDVNDKPLKKGLPSQPVRIVGFDSVPKAGEPVICVESEQLAEDLVTRRRALESSDDDTSTSTTANESELQSSGKHMMNQEWKEKLEEKYGLDSEEDGSPIRIQVIVKADADGTLAAIRDSLIQIGEETTHNVVIDPVKVAVGPVLASDIQMAKEGGASIICFNLKNEQTIVNLADEEGVPLLGSDVIYSLLDTAKESFARYLPPHPVEVVHGRANVQAVYDIGGMNEKVAGLKVTDGKLYKEKTMGNEGELSCQFRVIRNGEVISPESALSATSLKHFQEDVNEISRGKDCGLALSGYSDFEEDDVIECFSIEMRREFI